MGFYSGAIPAVVKPITIPSSGSIQIEIKSTLTNSAGNLTQLVAGQLEDIASADNLPRKGVNPITIHGVQGILSAGTSNVYGIHFYNASNKSVGGYNSSSYAQTIHPSFSDTPTKVRVCVNADSIEDLQNCSAHLTINNTIIELIPSIRNTGGLSPSGGTSTAYAHCMYSDYIDISQVGTINTIYIDGLAVPAEYTFTRLEDGDSVDVNEYDMVGIANHDFFKQCIPMYYVNNFAYTGREKAEDWVFVAKNFVNIMVTSLFLHQLISCFIVIPKMNVRRFKTHLLVSLASVILAAWHICVTAVSVMRFVMVSIHLPRLTERPGKSCS